MSAHLDQLITEYYAAWNSHDADKIASFYTDDGVHEDVPLGKFFHGRDEIKAGIAPLFAAFPDFRQELKFILAVGDRMAHEWVMSGTQARELREFEVPAMGKKFSVRGASITELQDGRIIRNTDYWNLGTMLEQLGVSRASV
jgi:steroid delta-isomerase-like uncharacterized protein